MAPEEQGVGLLCLSSQLAQDPSIQTEKGSVMAAKAKPECRGMDTLCHGVRIDIVWSLTSSLFLPPASHASVLIFHSFKFGSVSGPLQSGLAADFFPPPCLHPSALPHTSFLQSLFLAASACTPVLSCLFLACLLLQPIRSPRARTVCFRFVVSPYASGHSLHPVTLTPCPLPHQSFVLKSGLWSVKRRASLSRAQVTY